MCCGNGESLGSLRFFIVDLGTNRKLEASAEAVWLEVNAETPLNQTNQLQSHNEFFRFEYCNRRPLYLVLHRNSFIDVYRIFRNSFFGGNFVWMLPIDLWYGRLFFFSFSIVHSPMICLGCCCSSVAGGFTALSFLLPSVLAGACCCCCSGAFSESAIWDVTDDDILFRTLFDDRFLRVMWKDVKITQPTRFVVKMLFTFQMLLDWTLLACAVYQMNGSCAVVLTNTITNTVFDPNK